MFNLTQKETKAAVILVKSCMANMGGKRPCDLGGDEFTWVSAEDLTDAGLSRFEAAGIMSALSDKGIISEYDKNEWILTTEAWQWLDTVWDELEGEGS